MYEVGTLVLYDKRGVYRIESMGAPPVREISGDYYRLCAVFSNSNEIIYTPAGTVSSMRPLISGSEAVRQLELFSQLEPRIFRFGKPMDLIAHYKSMLASHKVEDCLLLIKEIHIRQKEMVRQKKQLGQTDTQYLKLAEKLICEEFAVVLDTTPDLIRERLYKVTERKATA